MRFLLYLFLYFIWLNDHFLIGILSGCQNIVMSHRPIPMRSVICSFYCISFSTLFDSMINSWLGFWLIVVFTAYRCHLMINSNWNKWHSTTKNAWIYEIYTAHTRMIKKSLFLPSFTWLEINFRMCFCQKYSLMLLASITRPSCLRHKWWMIQGGSLGGTKPLSKKLLGRPTIG